MSAAPRLTPVKPSENPFRSGCVDALRFRCPGFTIEQIHARFTEAGFRGAIIGPHGHGKSTLLRQLAQRPISTGFGGAVYVQVAADGSNAKELRESVKRSNGVLFVDGYDLLPWRIRSAVRRRRHVVVTSHRKTALPTLIRCETSEDLLGELIGELSPRVRASMSKQAIGELHVKHGGNLRDALREMYDRVAVGEFSI